MFKNNSLDLGYFYNDDVDLGSVKFENSLKPSKTEGVPILSPVSDEAILHFLRRKQKRRIVECESKFGDIFIGWLSLAEIRRRVLKRRNVNSRDIQPPRFTIQSFPLSSSKVSIVSFKYSYTSSKYQFSQSLTSLWNNYLRHTLTLKYNFVFVKMLAVHPKMP